MLRAYELMPPYTYMLRDAYAILPPCYYYAYLRHDIFLRHAAMPMPIGFSTYQLFSIFAAYLPPPAACFSPLPSTLLFQIITFAIDAATPYYARNSRRRRRAAMTR